MLQWSGAHISLWDHNFIFLDIYPNCFIIVIIIFSILQETSILFFIVAVPVYFSTNGAQGFLYGLADTICYLLNDNHSNNWKLISYYGLIWVYLMVVILITFSCTCLPFVHLLGKNVNSDSLISLNCLFL